MAKPRDPLPRLNIPHQLSQQPQSMYSPALPTAIQQSFHPPFPVNSLQTPMQQFFTPQPPPAPGRPTHHQGRASIANLAAVGIHHPNAYMTPVTGHFPHGSIALGPGLQMNAQPGSSHPFPNRNRRQLSIGGPPKAVLGGPARKLSPLPAPPLTAVPQKTKKTVVSLPKETIPGEDGEPTTRPSWARTPLPSISDRYVDIPPVDVSTAEIFPQEPTQMPDVIDVFLPGKVEWENLRRRAIEEKLERLGVEPGSGSNFPHIHAPHARAASISSPADPALLMFKLSKLQQSQDTSSTGTSSPQPMGLSPSPHRPPPRFMNQARHGHSLSLVQPPSYQSPFYDAAATAFNPFGPNAVLGSDQIVDNDHSTPPSAHVEPIYAPQGRVPLSVAQLAPPLSASRSDSRPDFSLGFGLDIPEEAEEDEEMEREKARDSEAPASEDGNTTQDMELEEEIDRMGLIQEAMSSATSRHHSRHTSKLSAALSLRSVGGVSRSLSTEEPREIYTSAGLNQIDDLEEVAGEWTGSEDAYVATTETSDAESLGEFSNPSDEERARQQRAERRMRRRIARQRDEPRRIPQFPQPPENTVMIPMSRDSDIISNPSDDELVRNQRNEYMGISVGNYYAGSSSNDRISPHLLQPLPHSRNTSAQYSINDPAQAHSRVPSDVLSRTHQQRPSSGSLNPFAKPFVFGMPRETSGTWSASGGVSTPPNAPMLTHSRLPSFGKPLNVAAPEFKPIGFTFRPPQGVPAMPAPPPVPNSPEKEPEASPFHVQGREKRPRRGSSASMEEGDSMTSFKFPLNLDSPRSIRRTGSFNDARHKLNPSAEPFTFAGFSAVANLPYVPKASDTPDEPSPDLEDTLQDESTAKGENGEPEVEEVQLPSASKPKRAPIPLDFKHTASGNTVPAGLFKALANGDERTRRTVRSRLSSREIYEHTQMPSMDDLTMPQIARKVSRGRLVTDPGEWMGTGAPTDDDVFTSARHTRRRSSLPDALHDEDGDETSASAVSTPPQDLTHRMETHRLEEVVGKLLDEKFSVLHRDLLQKTQEGQTLTPATESMIGEVISLFRSQLQESAAHSLEDSQMDARGELDFQLIKNVVEDSQQELMNNLRAELHDFIQHMQSHGPSSHETAMILERIGNRNITAVLEAISEFTARQEAINHGAPARDRDAMVDKLVNALAPMLGSIRPEPIDYDFLTNQLSQAVKPHISQLIDLASDKRETAGLIVDKIIPLLPSLNTTFNTDAITLQLITEVRRAIAPIDAFEIKEQVADLVVERLDSRLAVRDKALNVDRVMEGVLHLLEPVQQVQTRMETVASKQDVILDQHAELVAAHGEVVSKISELPSRLEANLQGLSKKQADIVAKLDSIPQTSNANENFADLKSTMNDILAGQKAATELHAAFASFQKETDSRLTTIPGSIASSVQDLQAKLLERIASNDSLQREIDEIRKSNTEYQLQLTKARAAHGQVRVEKDFLSEKLVTAEEERERIRMQLKELQTSSTTMKAENATLTTRTMELEEALAKALANLQSSDVATQVNQKRIVDLEKTNVELQTEKQSLKTKVDTLELQATFANRDKEAAAQALQALQLQYDRLSSQQAHWDDLRQASEKIDMLTNLIGQADNEELAELRQHRDRTKVLENDHAALQKRFKESETKALNNERSALAARQSLVQAQQRSTEWERRAKDYEGQLELTRTKLEQAEEMQAQLETDFSLAKLQLEEREADDRLAKDRESKLLDQVKALEAKVTVMQSELEKARLSKQTAITPSIQKLINSSTNPPPRPDSRASTIYDDRSTAPNRRISTYTSSGRSDTPPRPSVWDSMHAPTATNVSSKYPNPNDYSTNARINTSNNPRYPHLGPATPKARRSMYTPQYQRTSMPSPTPSTVSLAPTQGDDGWWE